MRGKRIVVAPEYCGVYVAGSIGVEVPISNEAVGILGTRECINVPCLYWNDGDTTIIVGVPDEVLRPGAPAYDGMLATPQKEVLVYDVNNPEMLRADTPGTETRIRIWTNHPTEPDEIVIAVG